jgi:arylsulfatase A-like enzyme
MARKRATDINLSTLNWIDADRRRPFLAFLNYIDVHTPEIVPYSYLETKWAVEDAKALSTMEADPVMRQRIDHYDNAIRFVDLSIAELLDGLRKRGLIENTIIAITSDHGESFREHHQVVPHGSSLYREEIQVPLILMGPGVPKEKRIRPAVTTRALSATLLDLAGIAIPRTLRVPSLRRQWNGPVGNDEEYAFAELKSCKSWIGEPRTTCGHGWIKTVVTLDWQYLEFEKSPPELYRWREDKLEKNNLSSAAAGQAVQERLGELLKLISEQRSDVPR